MNIDREKAYIDEAAQRVNGCLTIIASCIVAFVLGTFAGIGYQKHKTNIPIENNTIIDSLTAINDSIKIKVEKLDSIKDAKIIEVSTLDNDSTLKLFYKLVSE